MISKPRFLSPRRPILLFAALLGLGLLAIGGAQADHDGTHTLEGEYWWTGGGTGGDLEAVFTPTGENTWDVDFHFRFRDRPHTYTGTAEGSMDGALKGTVKNENKRRTFTFNGTFEEGTFVADHYEILSSGERRTGNLEMAPSAG